MRQYQFRKTQTFARCKLANVQRKTLAEKSSRAPKDDGRRSDEAINAYARHRVERWFQDNPNAKATELAEKLDLSSSFITRLRKEGDGVGWHAARQLARVFGMTLAEFVAEADRYWADGKRGGGELPLSKRPGWAEARARVIQEHGLSTAEVDKIGEITAQLSQPLNSEMLFWLVIGSRATPVTKVHDLKKSKP